MAQTTALPSHAPLVSQLARAKSFTELELGIPQYFFFHLSEPIQTFPDLSQHIATYPNLSQPIPSHPTLSKPI